MGCDRWDDFLLTMRVPYRVRSWLVWREWRWRWTRLRGFFQRGRRGWADHDTWSFDHYLAGVLAGGLRHLADHHHGVPVGFGAPPLDGDSGWTREECDEADRLWTAWLREKADWFDWYHRDEDGTEGDTNWVDADLSDEVRRQRIDAHCAKMQVFLTEVLPDFVKFWPNLWD